MYKVSLEMTWRMIMIVMNYSKVTGLELSHAELEMAITGQLVDGMNTSCTVSVSARHKEAEREKTYTALPPRQTSLSPDISLHPHQREKNG